MLRKLFLHGSLIATALLLSVSACTPAVVGGDCSRTDTRVRRSVVPVPRTWNQQGILESYRTAADLGCLISLPDPVDWFDAENKSPRQSKAFREFEWNSQLVRQHSLEVFIQVDPYKPRRGPMTGLPATVRNPSFADPVLRRAYKADVLQRAELYRPKYLCLAMEINAYFEEHPEDFDNFVTLFKETRNEIKRSLPDSIVFVSFQYEQFLGRFGGQGHLRVHEPHWELIDRFGEELDAVGISTYPMSSFAPARFGRPEDLPQDYYSQIARHTTKPVIFAEVGWPSDAAFGGSPESQAAFVRQFDRMIQGMNVPLVNWFMLYDANGFGAFFSTMGLLDRAGTKKPAFDAWLDLGR